MLVLRALSARKCIHIQNASLTSQADKLVALLEAFLHLTATAHPLRTLLGFRHFVNKVGVDDLHEEVSRVAVQRRFVANALKVVNGGISVAKVDCLAGGLVRQAIIK